MAVVVVVVTVRAAPTGWYQCQDRAEKGRADIVKDPDRVPELIALCLFGPDQDDRPISLRRQDRSVSNCE